MSNKLYTKTGDNGLTSLIGGTKVPKHHVRIESYGTIDELNSHIGLLKDHPIDEHTKLILATIQDKLFTIGAILASDPEKKIGFNLPQLTEDDTVSLENEIDKMTEILPELKSFILPGGHVIASHCHIARTVCRRAERNIIYLSESSIVSPEIVKYINRLSDYLFVLARFFIFQFNAKETPWISRV